MRLRADCAADLVSELCEAFAHCTDFDQAQGRVQHASREQGLAVPERDGSDLDDEFDEQAGVKELASKFPSAHDPDVAISGSGAHRFVHRLHGPRDESDVMPGHRGERTRGEDPGGLLLRPPCTRLLLDGADVP